jgi:hypothetical protein
MDMNGMMIGHWPGYVGEEAWHPPAIKDGNGKVL